MYIHYSVMCHWLSLKKACAARMSMYPLPPTTLLSCVMVRNAPMSS